MSNQTNSLSDRNQKNLMSTNEEKLTKLSVFQKRADEAAFWEAWTGMTLTRSGLWVVQHPFDTTENTGKPPSDYSQTWDLDVASYWPDIPDTYWHRLSVEVKSRTMAYHSVQTYPKPTAFVCSLYSWNKKWPGKSFTQRDFLFVSTKTGAIVWLPKGSPVEFGNEVFDGEKKQLYKIVITQKANLRELADFVDYVKEGLW